MVTKHEEDDLELMRQLAELRPREYLEAFLETTTRPVYFICDLCGVQQDAGDGICVNCQHPTVKIVYKT